MAEIDLERRRGGAGWLWGLLALAAIALIVWWVWPDAEEPIAVEDVGVEAVEPVAEQAPPEAIAEPAGIPVSQIIASPATFTGQTVNGEVRVTEVPTDRGFWIEDQGNRLFAVIVDQPEEQPKDINPGMTLRLSQATVRDASFLGQVPGVPLDEDTRSIAEQQQVFLVVPEGNIEMLGKQAGGGA